MPQKTSSVTTSTSGTGIAIEQIALQPAGTVAERKLLASELEVINSKQADTKWEILRASLHATMQSSEFWDSPDRQRVLARYALIDRVTAATATAHSLDNRLDRSGGTTGKPSRELLSRLALQLYVVKHGIEDVLSDALIEVTLIVQPSHERRADTQSAANWAERLAEMYGHWASKRRMQWSAIVLPNSSAKALAITGFGAARILSNEIGLHVLEHGKDDNDSDRVVARVEVIPTPLGVTELKPSDVLARLKNTPSSPIIIRRYRLDSSPLIRDARKGWRTGKVHLVLDGDFDLITS
jgi:ATP-dependent Clp protease ATP-binding subunit ClpC